MVDHIVSYPCTFYEEVIPTDLLNLIVEEVEKIPSNEYCPGQIMISSSKDEFSVEESTRNSKIFWWNEIHWVSSIFSHYFNKANRENWQYDLDHIESIQITSYNEGDHYSWHSDYGPETDDKQTRKLSASLIITDPLEYEGGDLELVDYHNNLITPPTQRGTIIIFDSRVPHRVTPVTKGRRISLVSWMLGPKLR